MTIGKPKPMVVPPKRYGILQAVPNDTKCPAEAFLVTTSDAMSKKDPIITE